MWYDVPAEADAPAPFWQARLTLAHTIPRELRGSNGYVFEPTRFSRVRTPSLMLQGNESPPFLKAGTAPLHAALPASRIAALAGQHHGAMNATPAPFVGEVLRFLMPDQHSRIIKQIGTDPLDPNVTSASSLDYSRRSATDLMEPSGCASANRRMTLRRPLLRLVNNPG